MLGIISAFVFKLLGDLASVHLQREFKDTAITRLYHPLFNPSCTMFPFLTFRPRMMSRIQTRSANWSSGAGPGIDTRELGDEPVRSVKRSLRISPLWRLAHRVARCFRLSCSVASVYDDVLARGKRCTG